MKKKTGPKGRTTTGSEIVKLLKTTKLTPREIAERLDVTPSAVRYYKRMLERGVAK